MYATGRGIKADPVQAARWHLIARAGGDGNLFMEDFLRKMSAEDRAAAEASAKVWISRIPQLAAAAATSPTPQPAPSPAVMNGGTIRRNPFSSFAPL